MVDSYQSLLPNTNQHKSQAQGQLSIILSSYSSIVFVSLLLVVNLTWERHKSWNTTGMPVALVKLRFVFFFVFVFFLHAIGFCSEPQPDTRSVAAEVGLGKEGGEAGAWSLAPAWTG